MSSAVVVEILAAALLARFVQTTIPPNLSQVEGHPSEGSQSDQISSRARGPVVLAGTSGMFNDDLNKDKSYVLIPLKDLMRNRRNSKVGKSGTDGDPLYVMFPFHEIMRKTREGETNLEVTAPVTNAKVGRTDRRIRRQISLRQWPLNPKVISKRKPLTLSVRRGRMNSIDMSENDCNEHEETLTDLLRADSFAIEHKKSPFELKSQLRPEMDGLHQKPRVLTEFSDLSPKVLQNVVGKPKKSSGNPINITMFISNLIPPNEVENTRITNAGKLYKSGCLKFSIQLERPVCSGTTDENNEDTKSSSTCPTVVYNKMASAHHGAADEKSKPVEGTSSSSQGCCASVPASKVQNPETSRNDPSSVNHDATSLLLQLIGADQKLLKKPSSTSSQAVLMDNDVIKELQRLFANQAASKGPETSGKSMSGTSAPISQSNSKARAIAEALNLFSKYTSLKQLRSS